MKRQLYKRFKKIGAPVQSEEIRRNNSSSEKGRSSSDISPEISLPFGQEMPRRPALWREGCPEAIFHGWRRCQSYSPVAHFINGNQSRHWGAFVVKVEQVHWVDTLKFFLCGIRKMSLRQKHRLHFSFEFGRQGTAKIRQNVVD